MPTAATVPERKLPFAQRLSFAFGHVQNDLSSAVWFSYSLIYFHLIKKFDSSVSGYFILIGQVSNGLSTPFIGYELDRSKGICKLGKRKSCHLVGALCVTLSFPFIFSDCVGCSDRHTTEWAQYLYYAPIVVIFQFGWAAVEVSHLSLIPDLTSNANERVELNGLRNAFTILSNIMVFGIAWLLFGLQSDSGDSGNSFSMDVLQKLAFIVTGIGVLFILLFHVGVREKVQKKEDVLNKRNTSDSYNSERHDVRNPVPKQSVKTWKDWLKHREFYKIIAIYMCTRLFVNISQIYLPLYAIRSLLMEKESVAILPLVIFISGFSTSLLMKTVNQRIGRKTTYFVGQLFAITSCLWFYLIPNHTRNQVYGTCILFGVSATTMVVTSLSMTADLIADNVDTGGFVYGVMSFADKLFNGVAVALIQGLQSCTTCSPSSDYFRSIVTFVPGSAVVVGLIVFLTTITQNVRQKQIIVKTEKNENCEKEPLLTAKYESFDAGRNEMYTTQQHEALMTDVAFHISSEH